MLVLGVDPGLTRCGLGAVEGTPGGPLTLRHVEVVRTPAGMPLPERLVAISDAVEGVVRATSPDVMAVERMFSQHNLHTVMGTAQASAAAIIVAGRGGIPVRWHTPTEVKAAVTGSGSAQKEQVAAMVVRLLRLRAAPRPVDATDALALAICQVWRGAAERRIAAAARVAGARR